MNAGFDQPLGKFLGVGDRGRGKRELGLRAVETAQSTQATKQIGDIGAKDSSVDMKLVEHDPAQILEQHRPARVVGEDSHMKHVRVGDQNPTLVPDLAAARCWGVPIIGANGDSLDGT